MYVSVARTWLSEMYCCMPTMHGSGKSIVPSFLKARACLAVQCQQINMSKNHRHMYKHE